MPIARPNNFIKNTLTLEKLLTNIRACRHCEQELPLGPRPILRLAETSQILIIGQAPGIRVHESGIPWDDLSGIRLREWLGIDEACFYDEHKIAIVPMGFCYPGKDKSGDLPPRKECMQLWGEPLQAHLKNIKLTILTGHYAQQHNLAQAEKTLTATVKNWRAYLPKTFVLPHPSPRNNIWLKKNPWFEKQLVPALQQRIQELI